MDLKLKEITNLGFNTSVQRDKNGGGCTLLIYSRATLAFFSISFVLQQRKIAFEAMCVMPPNREGSKHGGSKRWFFGVVFYMSIRVMTKTTSKASSTLIKTSQMPFDSFVWANQIICLCFGQGFSEISAKKLGLACRVAYSTQWWKSLKIEKMDNFFQIGNNFPLERIPWGMYIWSF